MTELARSPFTAAIRQSGTERVVEQVAPARLIGLFLLPGALLTAAFVALAPVAERLGLPPLAALLAGVIVVVVPVELGLALRAGPSPFREPMAPRTWAWLAPVLVLAAFAGFGLGALVEPAILRGLFDWLPAWYVDPLPVDRVGEWSPAVWIGTLVAFLVVNGIVGPVVEELYFRGFLLPRMQYLGRWAPLVNVALFSVYHLWSPWQVLSRIAGFGPTVYAVQRTRNIRLGMVVHCTLNVLGASLVAALVVGRL